MAHKEKMLDTPDHHIHIHHLLCSIIINGIINYFCFILYSLVKWKLSYPENRVLLMIVLNIWTPGYWSLQKYSAILKSISLELNIDFILWKKAVLFQSFQFRSIKLILSKIIIMSEKFWIWKEEETMMIMDGDDGTRRLL